MDNPVNRNASALSSKTVSPYLERPLRSLSEVLAVRHDSPEKPRQSTRKTHNPGDAVKHRTAAG